MKKFILVAFVVMISLASFATEVAKPADKAVAKGKAPIVAVKKEVKATANVKVEAPKVEAAKVEAAKVVAPVKKITKTEKK